ncbi:MAG: class I SAM-dependent methyltransferase [Clostridium sp.]|uniref:tRNA (adenine(22)-N(1))-methyltransferase n=1 Tax=Clostridium sp. TaxID=1506 RepID=UPI003064F8F2
MIISKRLKLISSLVTGVRTIVDVGTDHGYVPLDLLKSNEIDYAIASDINKGPVEKARKNLSDNNLSHKVDCRLGGGLKTVRPGEVEAAVIAGMGGNLIRDILEESQDVFKKLEYVIVQPVQNPEVLRAYLYKSGCEILDEWIIYDEEKYYEILKIKWGNNVKQVEPIYYEVSKILLDKKDEVYKEYLNFKKDKYDTIYEGLKGDTENSKSRKKELGLKIDEINLVLDSKV